MKYFLDSAKAIQEISHEKKSLDSAIDIIIKTLEADKKILVAGNGGSNADAQHFVGELICTFDSKNRKGLSAIHLGGNTSALTAWANDFNFETYYQREIEALGKKGDLLILISTGGGNKKNKTSYNLILANDMAKNIGMKTLSLIGKSGGYLKKNSDVSIHIKNNITSIIQECHISVIHYLCYQIDKHFNNV